MGIFKLFKEMREFKRLMKELPREIERQQAAYRDMTPEAFAALPDDDLFSAAHARTEARIDYEQIWLRALISYPTRRRCSMP